MDYSQGTKLQFGVYRVLAKDYKVFHVGKTWTRGYRTYRTSSCDP